MGYKFQFITLAGFHALNHSMFELAHGYADGGHDRVRRSCRRPSSPPRPTATPRSSTRREVGTGYFDAVSTALNPRAAPPPRWPAPPRRSSSDDRTSKRSPSPASTDRPVRRDPDARGDRLRRAAGPGVRRAAGRAAGPRGGAGGPTATADLDFLAATTHIRDDPSWPVAPPAADLTDRRVEITGPPERKMTINALNSGAKVWMADFEDATVAELGEHRSTASSTCSTRSAARSASPRPTAGEYTVGDGAPTIMVRPRGWHLPEATC